MLADPLNMNVKIVWIDDVIGTAESLIASEKYHSIEDLRGKRIAVPFGSTAHFSLLSALNEVRINPSQVELINLQPDAMLAAWERSEIDAAWIWDPTLSELKKNGNVLLSSADTAENGRPTFDLSVATSDFIENNGDFMRVWTQLQSKAAEILNNSPLDAADSVALQLGISPAEAAKQIEGYEYLPANLQAENKYFGGGLEKVLQENAIFLEKQGIVESHGGSDRYTNSTWPNAIKGTK